MRSNVPFCAVFFAVMALCARESSLAQVLSRVGPSNFVSPAEIAASKLTEQLKPSPSPAEDAGASRIAQEGESIDTPVFLARETEVRRSFLERYPPSGRAAKLAHMSTVTSEERFDMSVALVMVSRLVPSNAKPPSYWRAQFASIANTQSMGTGLESLILGHADTMQPDPKSVDMLARQNMQIFRAMAMQYSRISHEKFDSSSPLLQAQYILSGAKGAAEDISFPCPYTVYLLDEDKLLREDQPHFARDFFGHLAGHDNDDYLKFESYNRQQRTQALKSGFIAMIERSRIAAIRPELTSLDSFAGLFGMSVISSNGKLTFNGLGGNLITDDMLITSIFGLEG